MPVMVMITPAVAQASATGITALAAAMHVSTMRRGVRAVDLLSKLTSDEATMAQKDDSIME